MKTDYIQFFQFRELAIKYSPGREKIGSMTRSSLLHLALFRLRVSK
jgi:hypothetical protein